MHATPFSLRSRIFLSKLPYKLKDKVLLVNDLMKRNVSASSTKLSHITDAQFKSSSARTIVQDEFWNTLEITNLEEMGSANKCFRDSVPQVRQDHAAGPRLETLAAAWATARHVSVETSRSKEILRARRDPMRCSVLMRARLNCKGRVSSHIIGFQLEIKISFLISKSYCQSYMQVLRGPASECLFHIFLQSFSL